MKKLISLDISSSSKRRYKGDDSDKEFEQHIPAPKAPKRNEYDTFNWNNPFELLSFALAIGHLIPMFMLTVILSVGEGLDKYWWQIGLAFAVVLFLI